MTSVVRLCGPGHGQLITSATPAAQSALPQALPISQSALPMDLPCHLIHRWSPQRYTQCRLLERYQIAAGWFLVLPGQSIIARSIPDARLSKPPRRGQSSLVHASVPA